MQFRCSYGGMNGDINMLDKMTFIWYDRFINKKLGDMFTYLYLKNEDIIIEELNPKEILIESYDFHCTDVCDRINKILNNHFINKDLIKKLIWNNSSSINYRFDINYPKYVNKNNDLKYWNIVKKIRDNEVKKIFNLYFN